MSFFWLFWLSGINSAILTNIIALAANINIYGKIVVTNLLEQISNCLDEGEQFQLEATPTNGNREFYMKCGMKYKPENQDGVYLWIKK